MTESTASTPQPWIDLIQKLSATRGHASIDTEEVSRRARLSDRTWPCGTNPSKCGICKQIVEEVVVAFCADLDSRASVANTIEPQKWSWELRVRDE